VRVRGVYKGKNLHSEREFGLIRRSIERSLDDLLSEARSNGVQESGNAK
jgi:hypothetical protein